MCDDNRDHFRHGSVAVGEATTTVTGSYFGLLVLVDDTAFSVLLTDAVNSDTVLAGLTYPAGTYLPVGINSVNVSAGAVLIGKTKKRLG